MVIERTFPVDRLDDVQVELRRGDIQIAVGAVPVSAQLDELQLPPDPHAASVRIVATLGTNVSESDLDISLEGGQLRVLHRPRGRIRNFDLLGGLDDVFSEGFGSLFSEFGRVDVRVTLPPNVGQCRIATGLGGLDVAGFSGSLLGKTGKGDVTVTDGSGRANVAAGMGTIQVSRFDGELDVAAGKGDLYLENVAGDASVKTGLGNVYVRDCNPRLNADSGKGDLLAERVGGVLKLTTGLGNLEVVDARGADVEATTGKGNVSLAGAFATIHGHTGLGNVTCEATTLSDASELNVGHGSVSIGLTGAVPVRVDASTSRGTITSVFPLVQVGRPGPESAFGRRLVGTVGNADGNAEPRATLRLRLVNGNVRVYRIAFPTALGAAPTPAPSVAATSIAAPAAARQEAPASADSGVRAGTATATAEPVTVAPASPEPRRLSVLERLSRGEITVEQADALLRE